MSTKTLLSMEAFLCMPDMPGKQELLKGELISLPPAKRSHMEISKRLVDLFRPALDDERVWFETGYQLHGQMLQPDVSVNWPDQRVEDDWFQGAPMIAVEVASRGNTAEEIEGKVAAYLEEGAAEVWVIYPKTRSMTVSSSARVMRVTGAYRCDLLTLQVDVPKLLLPDQRTH
jgi:Uma2 family endonuclease